MATFILVIVNMYHRAKHVAMRGSNVDMRIGMAFHIMMNSVKMCYNKFNAHHAVFCLEGRHGVKISMNLINVIVKMHVSNYQLENKKKSNHVYV